MRRDLFIFTARTLRRRPGFVVLNVAGLAVGMACCLLIALYVRDELAFDRFHEKADRLYRVVVDEETVHGTAAKAVTPGYLGPALAEAFPEVERAVRLARIPVLLQAGDRKGRERAVYWADAGFFDAFSFRLLRGDAATALAAPRRLVLTEAAARRYFGDADPLGQTVLVDQATPFTVAGVVAAPPAASHLQFDVLVSMATLEAVHPDWLDDWTSEWVYTYVLVGPQEGAAALAAKLPAFVERRLGAAMREADERHAVSLQPLADVHFDTERLQPPAPPGSRATLSLFAAAAVLILVVAGINFVNLSTAQGAERAKEVGVRKVVGASRTRLALQFVGEAVVLAVGAMGAALLLSETALPLLAALTGRTPGASALRDPALLALCAATALGVGVLAGSYPAFVLSRFRPADVLKGASHLALPGAGLRRALAVFQFGTGLTLVVAALVVQSQLGYVRTRDLGFTRAPMLVLHTGGDEALWRHYDAVKQALAAHPAVESLTASSDVPGTSRIPATTFVEDAAGALRETAMIPYMVDEDYTRHFGLTIVAGRTFSRAFPADSALAMLVNEAAVRALGYTTPEQIVGRRYEQWGREGIVVGVVKDFHVRSLHEPVAPMTLRLAPADFRFVTLRLRTDDLPRTLAELEGVWRRVAPHLPFEYSFVDERLDALYQADVLFGRLFGLFAGLALFVAALGLFGLAAFTAQRRTREIGVRKVLGASTAGIAALLARDVTRPVLLAFVLSAPAAYLAMDHWLARFAYRTTVSPLLLVLAGLGVLGVALLAVAVQTLRAARANPAAALRHG